MKKMILISFLLISTLAYSQINAKTSEGKEVALNDDGTWKYTEVIETTSENNIHIIKKIDDMTDGVYYYISEKLVCQAEDKKKGFSIAYSIDGEKDNEIKVDGLILKVIGLGCLEKVKILFLFQDDTKLTVTNWNKFNCKGTAWFNVREDVVSQLNSKKIKKVRVQNGHNFKSYTHELDSEQSIYMIDSYNSIKDKNIIVKN